MRCRFPLIVLITLVTVPVAAQTATKKSPAKNPPATAAASPPRDEIAAVVNGQKIMLSELLARMDELEIVPAEREKYAAHVLNALIDDLLLVQFLSTQKIPHDPKAVDTQIALMRTEVEKEGMNFHEALAKLGLSEQRVRNTLIAESQWQNYVKQRVSEKQMSDHFAKYREHFDGSEVRASHILVEVAADADASARAAAKAKAERIRQELVKGLDFATAAQKFSDCPSKEQGGDVDWFPRRGKMVEPFAKTAFTLKVGEISQVVETEFGYHLIKVAGRKGGKALNLNDPAMRTALAEAVGEPLKEEIAAHQRKTARIDIAPGIEAPATKTAMPPTNRTKK